MQIVLSKEAFENIQSGKEKIIFCIEEDPPEIELRPNSRELVINGCVYKITKKCFQYVEILVENGYSISADEMYLKSKGKECPVSKGPVFALGSSISFANSILKKNCREWTVKRQFT